MHLIQMWAVLRGSVHADAVGAHTMRKARRWELQAPRVGYSAMEFVADTEESRPNPARPAWQ